MARHEQLSINELTLADTAVAVTQGTNRSTGVTCNALRGVITTNATSLAAAGEATFTVSNTNVTLGSQILLTQRTPSATGTSLFFVSKVVAGSFDITLTNLHASTADTSASVVDFMVIRAG